MIPAFFRYPYRVAVKDSIAIIMDLHNDSHYFYAFTYPEWKPIAPFGKRGEAPGEMLSAEMFQFSALDSVWTLDANRMLITALVCLSDGQDRFAQRGNKIR